MKTIKKTITNDPTDYSFFVHNRSVFIVNYLV